MEGGVAERVRPLEGALRPPGTKSLEGGAVSEERWFEPEDFGEPLFRWCGYESPADIPERLWARHGFSEQRSDG